MPLFFFNYHTADRYDRDDIGCEFPSLELAYLDAFRGAIDITAELLHAGKSPSDHRIDILNADGQVLLDIPFEEVLRRPPASRPIPSSAACPITTSVVDLPHLIARAQVLRSEIRLVCIGANATIMATRALIERCKASGGPGLMEC